MREEEPPTFSRFLQDHDEGSVDKQIGTALDALNLSVLKHLKKGEMTIKIVVVPNSTDRVSVCVETTLKPPVAAAPTRDYYVTEEGRVTRRRPGQLSLDDLKQA